MTGLSKSISFFKLIHRSLNVLSILMTVPDNHFYAFVTWIKYFDPTTGKTFVFLTNNFILPAQTIADLYRCRWQVELFFKWIKQHLRIKSFFGTTENAVKSQVWIAVSISVLVAIIKKRLKIATSLYTILQILSITIFEKKPLLQIVTKNDYKNKVPDIHKQLKLFD